MGPSRKTVVNSLSGFWVKRRGVLLSNMHHISEAVIAHFEVVK